MDRSPERLLDAALPRWDSTERHARMVQAAPDSVWQAIRDASMRDLPMTRGLMRLRRAGKGSKGAPDRKVLGALPPGELARRGPHELFLGLVAPTSLRIGMDFRLTPVGRATRLETETRICATGPKAKRRFAAYWLVVGPGSGLIRRARRAEATGG